MTREEIAKEASKQFPSTPELTIGFIRGAKWANSHLWINVKDRLPDYDREVVVFLHRKNDKGEDVGYMVSLGHRPNPKGYVIVDGEKLYAKTYDGWNQPDVEWWLDADFPFNEDE